jgi:hypothetical protein
MFVIQITSKLKFIKPHLWKEGGIFGTKESAEFQAKQIRKMKDLYLKVEVIQTNELSSNELKMLYYK